MEEHDYMSKELEVSRTELQGPVALPISTWSLGTEAELGHYCERGDHT